MHPALMTGRGPNYTSQIHEVQVDDLDKVQILFFFFFFSPINLVWWGGGVDSPFHLASLFVAAVYFLSLLVVILLSHFVCTF